MKTLYSLLAILLFSMSTMFGTNENLKLNNNLIAYDGFSGNDFGWSGNWYEFSYGNGNGNHHGWGYSFEENYFNYSTDEVSLNYESANGISVKGGSKCMKATETNWGSESKALVRYPEDIFSNDFEKTFYVSFLAQLSETPGNSWSYIAVGVKRQWADAGGLLGVMNNKNKMGAAFARDGAKKAFVGNAKPVAGQTYMVVVKFSEINYWDVFQNIDIYINPIATTVESAEFHNSVDNANMQMGPIALQAYFHDVAYFDEIRVGSTWQSVVSSIDNSNNSYDPESKVTTFMGPTGSWNDESMWSNGVPDSEIDTVVIKGSCKVDKEVKAKDLVVANTGKLYVQSGGNIVTEKPIVLQAGLDVSAEYEQEAEGENLSVEKQEYFATGMWNFICMPDSMTADELFPDLKLASYKSDPKGDYWVGNYSQEARSSVGTGMQWVFDPDFELIEGRGYMVWVDKNQVRTFKYESMKKEVSVNTTNTIQASLGHAGWNLVGNPFSHSMTYADVFDNCPHNKEYFTGAVYVYDGDGYKVWTDGVGDEEARSIAPMEAFFVKRMSDNGVSEAFFMNGSLSVDSETEYASKLAKVEEVTNALTIGVNMKKGFYSDYTYIKMADDASVGLDENLDAVKWENSNDYKDIIYSTDASTCFAANAVSLSGGYCEVPLVISLVQGADSVTLSFMLEGDSSYNFSLIDDDELTIVPLSQAEDITLFVNQEDYIEGRFSVEITKAINAETGLDNIATSLYNDLAKITTVDKSIVIESLVSERLSVGILGVNGQLLDGSRLLSGETVNKQMNSGIYIVRLSNGSRSVTKKLMIK